MTGVAFTTPPAKLIPDLQASITRAVAAIPKGSRGALVSVVTDTGVNAAVVTKIGNDWAVQAWIGKNWGERVHGGAAVTKTW